MRRAKLGEPSMVNSDTLFILLAVTTEHRNMFGVFYVLCHVYARIPMPE